MIHIQNSAKKYAVSYLFALLVIGLFSACASDNIHMPDPEDNLTEEYNGSFTTSIPTMPVFPATTGSNNVKLDWNDKNKKTATIELGAFEIDVEMMGRNFLIGAMHIENVLCTPNEDGTMNLTADAFECQAGEYLTKGRLTGKYVKGKLEITIFYKPGSMPFECKSVFEGTSED